MIELETPDLCIDKYDFSDKKIASYQNLDEVLRTEKYESYYYRFNTLPDTSRRTVSGEHFGVKVRSTGKLEFSVEDSVNGFLNKMIQDSRKIFPKYPPDKWRAYDKRIVEDCSFTWAWVHARECIERVKSQAYCHDEFCGEVNSFLSRWRGFKQIESLNECGKMTGLYFLILDKYNRCYVGQSNDIKRRIQTHWSKVNYATTGIDMFKAYDTTRIYVNPVKKELDKWETTAILDIEQKYLLNYFTMLEINGSQYMIEIDRNNTHNK